MQSTQANAEVVTAKVYDKKYWEKLGVKFKQSRTLSMSLSGRSSGGEFLTWTAYYKDKYLTSGGVEFSSILEWMNKKHDRMIECMGRIK